jgi:hypothetical protein
MAMVAHHANVAVSCFRVRATEGFHDSGIADATSGPKAQAVENHIHAIRVTRIDNCRFAVSCAAADFRGKCQLKRQGDTEASRGYQLCPSTLSLGAFPWGLEGGGMKDDFWRERMKCSRKSQGLEFRNPNGQEACGSAQARSTRIRDERHLRDFLARPPDDCDPQGALRNVGKRIHNS